MFEIVARGEIYELFVPSRKNSRITRTPFPRSFLDDPPLLGCFVLDCSSQNSCQFHHTSFASVSQILIILDLLESSSIMPRNSRQRGCTLLPGSPFHDAFFSQDESIRDAFDQEAVIAKFCKNRRKMWVRRRDSGSFLKSGRPMFPRYASF